MHAPEITRPLFHAHQSHDTIERYMRKDNCVGDMNGCGAKPDKKSIMRNISTRVTE